MYVYQIDYAKGLELVQPSECKPKLPEQYNNMEILLYLALFMCHCNLFER